MMKVGVVCALLAGVAPVWSQTATSTNVPAAPSAVDAAATATVSSTDTSSSTTDNATATTTASVPVVASKPAPAPASAKGVSTASPAVVGRGSYFDVNNRSVMPANTEDPLKVVSAPDGLDLQQCFQLAAVRSDTLQISAETVLAQQAKLEQAIAQLYPTVNFVSSHTFYHYKNGSYAGNNGSVSNQKDYNTATSLSVSQTIFDGFSNYNTVGAARAGVAADKYNLQRSYQILYQSVSEAFYQILSYQGDLIILSDSIRALEARAKDLEERVRIGRSRPSELLQAQSDLASTRVTIEESKGALAATRETMAYYLGRPANQIKLKETQSLPSEQLLEKYLSVTGTRPDILALVESQRQARRNLSAQKGALWPQVTAGGEYNLASDPTSNEQWYIGFQIQLPLFDGGLILSRIREQKSLVRQSELNLDDLRRTADQDVRTAYANFNASVAQVVRLQEQVALAALSYNAEAEDYRLGIVSNLDVLVALNNLQSARRSLNSADLTARLNLINLHVAAGIAAKSMGEVNGGRSGTVTGNPAATANTATTPKKANP
jgi:outer membrane protein